MITVFGLGFVGLTTALGFAHYGYKVYGIDVDKQKNRLLLSGEIPFLEPYLKEELKNAIERKKFFIAENIEEAVRNSKYIFYCVGTPYGLNGEADLSFLYQAMESTLDNIKEQERKILIIKSTIPPTTVEKRIVPFLEKKGFCNGIDVDIVNNPEFLREGHCWEDFIYADRIVVGCANDRVKESMRQLYQPFKIPFFGVSYNTAEFIKYLSNTLLAALISYANEMASFADSIGGIDIAESFHILHEDKRWNRCNMSSYFYPGCGYGGYCLPKDTNALLALAKGREIPMPILENVICTNERMPEFIADRIIKKVGVSNKIGIMGLSFKPESSDTRDSASAKIIRQLKKRGAANIIAYDPVAMEDYEETHRQNLVYAKSLEDIAEKSDVLVLLTAWKEFKKIREITDKEVLDFRYYLERNKEEGVH